MSLLLVLLGCGPPPERPEPPVVPADLDGVSPRETDADGLARLEAIEDATESFANRMLDLSQATRFGERGAMEAFFSADLEATSWPQERIGGAPAANFVIAYRWSLDPARRTWTASEAVSDLDRFVDHLVEVEDVRFKALAAEVQDEGRTIRAKLKLSFVGRNRSGAREWIRGRAEVVGAHDAEGRWRLTSLVLGQLTSLVSERDLFTEVSHATGLAAPLFNGRRIRTNFVPGAATADVDGDGRLDVLAVAQRNIGLYLNRGDGTFEVAGDPILGEEGRAAGVHSLNHSPLFVDFDNDGDPDLLLTGILRDLSKEPTLDTRLFRNRRVEDGQWSFEDVSERLGEARHRIAGRSPAAVDLNGDRVPDFYIPMWSEDVRTGDVRAKPDHYSNATNGGRNHLYLSRPDGTWVEAGKAWGVGGHDWSMASGFADYDLDGDFDLFVANDFGRNRLYVNRGDHFVEEADARGVHHGNASMGIHLADYDNDGDLDLHATNMSSTAGERILSRVLDAEGGAGAWRDVDRNARLWATGNKLYRNDGAGGFQDVSDTQGPFPGGWGWGGGFIDIDNDGWEDLYTPAGRRSGKSMHDT